MICHECRCVVGEDQLKDGKCKDPLKCAKRLSLSIKEQQDKIKDKPRTITHYLDRFR